MHKILQEYKCGEIFLSKASVYIFVCCHCKEKFDNFTSFRNHNKNHNCYENYSSDEDIYTMQIKKVDFLDEEEMANKVFEKIYIEKYDSDLQKVSNNSNESYILNDIDHIFEKKKDVEFDKESSLKQSKTNKFNSNFLKEVNDIPYATNSNTNSNSNDIELQSESLNEDSLESFNTDSINFPSFAKSKFENETFYSDNETEFKNSSHRKKKVYCPYCKYEFKYFENHDQQKCAVIQNIIKKHNGNYNTLENEGIYLCKECPRYFENLEKLALHRRSHCNSGTCLICDKEFISLERHIKSKHSGKRFEKSKTVLNMKIGPNPTLQCSYCDKNFKIKIHLQKHEQMHQNDSLKCDYCGKYFKAPILLKNHIRTHTGEKPFQCTECPTAFALKRNLNTHFIYKHTDDKPFECRHEGGCGKYFKTEQLRNNHEKRHNQNVEFQCEVCGMEFNIQAKLRMHYKKKHMDYSERPHQCHFCIKKFVEKGHLLEHERTHTGEKPLKCNQCSSSFAKRSSLQEHKKLHSGEKNHVCKICGKAFAQLAGYSNHVKKHY